MAGYHNAQVNVGRINVGRIKVGRIDIAPIDIARINVGRMDAELDELSLRIRSRHTVHVELVRQ